LILTGVKNCAVISVWAAIFAKMVFNFSNLVVEIFQIFVNPILEIWYAVHLYVLETVAYA
jgi:hypothetical protein